MKRKRTLLCLFLLGLVIFASFRLTHRTLPDDCTPVVNNMVDTLDSGNWVTADHWWLSESTLLLFHYSAGGGRSSVPGHFVLHDRKTGMETPLPQLSAAFNGAGAHAEEATLSWDGRFLCWKKAKWPLPLPGDNRPIAPLYEIEKGPEPRSASNGQRLQVQVRPVGTPQNSLRTFTFTLPPHFEIGEVAYSQRGDKIAWLVSTEPQGLSFPSGHERPPLISLLLAPGMIRIWISNIDGSDIRELGRYPLKGDSFYSSNSADGHFPGPIYDLKWLPDGKHLSFVWWGKPDKPDILYLASTESTSSP